MNRQKEEYINFNSPKLSYWNVITNWLEPLGKQIVQSQQYKH